MKTSAALKSASTTLRRNSISNHGDVLQTFSGRRRNSSGSASDKKARMCTSSSLITGKNSSSNVSSPLGGSQPLCAPQKANQLAKRRFSVSLSCDVAKEVGAVVPPMPLMSGTRRLRQPIQPNPLISQLIDRVPAFQARRLEYTFNAVWEKLENKYGRNAMMFPGEIVWLGGAPGAGKGTQSKYISYCKGIKTEPIVMSSLLDSPEARQLKAQGIMINDEMALEALLEELRKPKYRNGAVVDGFPRTDQQVQFVKLLHSKLRRTSFEVVVLHVDEAESINRQLSRGQKIIEQNKIFQEKGLPLLEVRETDISKEYATKRYQTFKEQMASMLSLKNDFPLKLIDASGSVQQVQQTIQYEMVPHINPIFELAQKIDHQVRKQARQPMMVI